MIIEVMTVLIFSNEFSGPDLYFSEYDGFSGPDLYFSEYDGQTETR